MKNTLLNILLFLTSLPAHAQINWGDYSQSYAIDLEDSSAIGVIVCRLKDNDSFWVTNEDSKHFSLFRQDSVSPRIRHGNIVARTTFDTARAHFFAHGITPGNARRFQYRVLEYPSNREITSWADITRFSDEQINREAGLPTIAYLGGHRTTIGKAIIVDIREAASGRIIATAMSAWESVTPRIGTVYTTETLNEFFRKLQRPWAESRTPRKAVDVNNLPAENNNIIVTLQANIYHREQIQYQLYRNGEIVTPWRKNEYDNEFVWIKDLPSGRYTLNIRYTVQPDNVNRYTFGIADAWYQSNLFITGGIIFTAAVIGAILFMILFIRQRQKNRRAESNRTKLQLELKALYAQLNPHFVFNALSSIQGLINRQNVAGANRYLADFARLMRETLNNSNKNDVSIAEEIRMLQTYLDLEQLRFGFRYTLDVDSAINTFETNIPSLLLQPLVENAVKHGVASMHEQGTINIRFIRRENDLITIIADNGKGMAEPPTPGIGMKLTQDRIALLNELRPTQAIVYTIETNTPSGTRISLRFNHWFL